MESRQIIPIKGMHCASCALTIEKVLSKSKGVINAKVSYATEKATLEFDNNSTTMEKLNESIKSYGYEFLINSNTNVELDKIEKLRDLDDQKEKVLFVLPISIMIFLFMIWEISNQSFSSIIPPFFIPMQLYSTILFILATIVLFWIGLPFLKGITNFVKNKIANMDTLVGIGTLSAYIYSSFLLLFDDIAQTIGLPETSYFDITIIVIGFIVFGKYLEAKSKLKTGEAIEKLINLQSKTALVEKEGKSVETPIEEVQLDDIVLIKPGGKIPVDGKIIEGKTSINESMITGEPIPVDKTVYDMAIGGTINKQGYIKIKASKVGSDTLLANIIRMVEEAQGSRAPIQRFADKISSIFVPIVLIISILTLLTWLILGSQFMPFNESLTYGILCFVGVLVIACPCALGLATPTAIIVGVGKGAQNGILIKNAESLEMLHQVDTLVVDKTGTITKGKPELTDIILSENAIEMDENEILKLLTSLENNSEHPLSIAIREKAKSLGIKPLKVFEFENIEGKGLKGEINKQKYYAGNITLMRDLKINFNDNLLNNLSKQGKTPILFANEKYVLATIAITDTIKETSKNAIQDLHNLGIKVVMLTGDNKHTAQYIGDIVGIDHIFAEVLPNQKAEKIQELQNQGHLVAMAGDGVNDAPALAQSNVGLAMGTGTDIAIESADITLLAGDISKIPQAIHLSKKTMKTIKENLFWAFIYNIIGIPLAAGLFFPIWGILLNPVFAGLAMAFSSVSVVSNSLRLKLLKL